MLDPSTKKKPTNLRLIEIINSQKINDIRVPDSDFSKSNKTRTNEKQSVKGKKIDNKTLKIRKRKDGETDEYLNPVIQLTNYHTNTESVSVIDTLPFRSKSRFNKSRNEFSEGTGSICTFDVNEQVEREREKERERERGKRMGHNRRASDVVKISWNKENSRSHSRNSLGFDRRMSYARRLHNRSCNDMEPGRQSKGQSKEKVKHNHYQSCNDGNVTLTPEKRHKTPKKPKKAAPQVTKNPTVKDINFKKPKTQNRKKTIESSNPKPLKKRQKDPKPKKQPLTLPQPRPLDDRQISDQQQPQYPVSKYINSRKPTHQPLHPITIKAQLYQRMLSSSNSLIRSIQTGREFEEEIIQKEIELIEIGESSLNLKEIRRYEEINKVSEEKLKRQRRGLYPDIAESYPEFNKQEIEFLSSVIVVQRWWRGVRRVRKEIPDQNLTEIIKGILNNAIRSQEPSPHPQLAQPLPSRNQPSEKRKFFANHDTSPPPPSKQFASPFDSFTMEIGDLEIPQSRIKQQEPHPSTSYTNLLQNEIFPPFDLMKQTRNDVLRKYTLKMDTLDKSKSFESSHEQHLIKEQMRKDLKQLDRDSKVIQKGYLTYLNSLKNLKSTPKAKSLLRKVNSSEGLMFELYKKVFKMEQYIQESDSVQELAKKVLIRKEWYGKKQSPLIHFGSDPSSPAHLSLTNNLTKKQKLQDFIGRSSQNIKNRPHPNILSLNEILQQYKNDPASQEVSEDYENQIMANLLQQEANEEDQMRVNEVIDMVLELIYLEFAEDIEARGKLRKKFTRFLENRHVPGIDCSDSAIRYYLNIVVEEFLGTQKEALVTCLNTPIGFSSQSILKLMREPDFSPPDRYIPPVDSRSFSLLQKIYFQRIDLNEIYKKNTNLVEQLMNVHNKGIFECFLSEIEQMKPNGENGIIHPWDAPRIIKHQKVVPEQIYFKLTEAIERVMKHCSFKAGLILENWVTRNARELQKAYQENQQRIVSMITSDLQEQQTKWKDLDQFLLEVRLDIDVLIIQWLFQQTAQEILTLI